MGSGLADRSTAAGGGGEPDSLSRLRRISLDPAVVASTHRDHRFRAPRRPGRPGGRRSRAVFDWSLWQILAVRPGAGTLTIEQGDLDIERRADGTVDLYETLRPVISEHPPKRLIIRVPDGRLRFRDRIFPEPVIADHADIWLDLGVDSEPVVWRINLARKDGDREDSTLGITGNSSRSEFDSLGGTT